MRTCPQCRREFPAVEGAPTQQCPHCGHESGDAPRATAAPARTDPAGAASEGFRLFRKHYGAILLVWLPAAIAEIVGGLALLAYERQTNLPSTLEALSALPLGDQLRLLGVVLPVVLVTYGVQMAMWTRVAAIVHRAIEPDAPALPKGRRSAAVFGLGMTLAFVHAAGLVFLIVPFLIFFHWFLFAPAALAGGASGIGAALEESRRMAKERKTYGFTALVLLTLVSATLLAGMLAASGIGMLRFLGVRSAEVDTLVAAGANWLLLPVVATLPAAFYFLARKAPAPGAPEKVDPGAPASQRFRTTKCPGCGTLVPYTATGQPVDVTCPVCGRSGKVL